MSREEPSQRLLGAEEEEAQDPDRAHLVIGGDCAERFCELQVGEVEQGAVPQGAVLPDAATEAIELQRILSFQDLLPLDAPASSRV